MEWISVKERLPDKNGQVIVWLGDDNFEHSTYKDGKFVMRYAFQNVIEKAKYTQVKENDNTVIIVHKSQFREDLTADVIAWAELIHPNDLKY